jgi:DNA polymerase-1
VTSEDIQKRFGVCPNQWCDFKALTGDASDEIKGIPGIGPKTAARLLSGGGCLENIDAASNRMSAKVKDSWSSVVATRELIRLRTGIPLPALNPSNIRPVPKARAVIEQLGLW